MSATRFELQASGAKTATGQGGGVAAAGIKEMLVFIDITAVSGTNPRLTLYLQASSDGGTTWYDLPHDGSVVHASGAIQGNAQTPGSRNILADESTTLKATARYRGAFGDHVRPAWVISGTTPSFTFSVKAIGKN